MNITEFDYHLPQHMIAQTPVEPRDHSRLMVLDGKGIQHMKFHQLPELLQPGDLLVLNNSKVVPARLLGTKETGGRVEVLILKALDRNVFECLVKGKAKTGTLINFNEGINGSVLEIMGSIFGPRHAIKFKCDGEFEQHLQNIGIIPLPPYIKKTPSDPGRYQTVYAEYSGSIAAPTAGLHFTEGLLDRIGMMGIRLAFITLHVGAGTFLPVRSDVVEAHTMDSEHFSINTAAASAINDTIDSGGRIVVVGTTTVRALESACWEKGRIQPSSGWSELFIYPPHTFRTPISGLITNFHLPRSTLLMLVSAYAGREVILEAYDIAIRTGYRFYSFGDAMLIMKGGNRV